MKKAINALFALLFLIITISGASAADKKKKLEIMRVDNYIAVFDFDVTTGDKDIARPLTESVRREIVLSGKYKVIDRGNMEKILGEHKLHMSGCVTGECIVETGQLLGVGKLIGGTVSKVGNTYYLTLSLISVKTGQIEDIAEDKCKCELDELLDSTKRLAKKLLGEKFEQPVATALKPSTVAESKAEAIARAKTEADELARQKALDAEREQLAAERRKFEAERAKVEAEAAAKAEARAEEIERGKAAQIVKAKAKAEAITKPAEPEQKIINSIGMTFVYIKPGTFMMGSPSGEPGRDNDETQHQVTLTKGFYMQTTEATQGQWRAVMGNNPSHFKNCGDDCPVERVSWNDAHEFIGRLNQKEGVSSYRLPTEAEWEYAAKGGTSTPFNTGNCLSTDQANYDGNNPFSGCSKGENRITTVRTGAFASNAWGLYDMHGNVWEWCEDWKGDYPSGPVTDPAGPSAGSYRVNRGGGWYFGARYCRSADRSDFTPDFRSNNLGFRLSGTP